LFVVLLVMAPSSQELEPPENPGRFILSQALLPATSQDEDYFCRIKDGRYIATRYDKLARNYLAATVLVEPLYCIKL
jgi:hypothetical protein